MKALRRLVLLFIVSFLFFSCARPSESGSVILMIGDGMGFQQIKAADYYFYGEDGRLSFESFPVKGSVTTYSADNDIIKMLHGSNERSKTLLFENILLNNTRLLFDLKMFQIDELKLKLEKFTVPRFNHEYIFRRKNITEVYFFNKPLQRDELKWPAVV